MQLPIQHSTPQILSEMEMKLQNAMGEVARLQQIVDDPDVVSMGKIYADEIVKLANQAPSAFKILMVMIGKMTAFNSLLISSDALGKLTTSSSSTVKRSIKLLREQEWIEVLKMGTTNVYRVNSGRVWHAAEHGEWAEFNAHVILNRDEQDNFTTERLPGEFTRHIPLVAANDYATGTPSAGMTQQGAPTEFGKNSTLRICPSPQRPELPLVDLPVLAPNVVPSQVDMFPAQR